MTTLTWSDQLALQQPQMDTTHEEFVALLAQTEAALTGSQDDLLARFDTLVEHTVGHFEQEDRWMLATGFAAENCHTQQHQGVLAVITECAKRARQDNDFEPLRSAVEELGSWFPEHALSMDAGLAQHLAEVGFDPVAGRAEIVIADAAPVLAKVAGCGPVACTG